jgi:predicted dehydrogenase
MTGKHILRFGIIGLGRHAKTAYLDLLCQESNVQLCTVCDLPTKEEQILRLLPNVSFYRDPEIMLQSQNIDAVIISTPKNLH